MPALEVDGFGKKNGCTVCNANVGMMLVDSTDVIDVTCGWPRG